MRETVRKTDLPLPLVLRGKVRDVYDAGENRLLLVASDRVSAFDVVLSQPIPRKGEVLTQVSAWWLSRVEDELREPHHLISTDPARIARELPGLRDHAHRWARRAMLVRRTEPVPVECVVRGYVAGSAWREYRSDGTLAGEPLPEGLEESQRLEEPVFSPATKAREGHDENIPFSAVEELVGRERARELRSRSMTLYRYGEETARERGILLADTKFEFGVDPAGNLLLIDEVMTPDSSRFWPAESWEPGGPQPSLDKQPIRDWLESRPEWDKSPPPPDLPDDVVQAASERYLELFRRLTGTELDDFGPPS